MKWTIDGSLALQNLDIIDGAKRICMIDCDDDRISDESHMANARLIAAAPDLLAALEDMLADAELLNEPYRNEALCERTRAAISKAQGA